MYATIKDNKFTGIVYQEMNDHIQKYHDDNNLTYIEVDSQLPNLGTDEEPDYGSPTQEQLDADVVNQLMRAGKKDEDCCRDVIRLIGGYNKQRNLSLEQIQQMITSFSPINDCLKNNMPSTAKALMANITPDEIVTQELIDKCDKVFEKYGI